MGEDVPSTVGNDQDTLDSTADMAKLLLRAKNIKEYHSVLNTAGSLTFPNGVAIESGVVVNFKNKGVFDGKWIIQKVSIHLVDGKLESEIEWRKCLIPVSPGYNVKYISQTTGQEITPSE
jgi:hypothetical protein